ncbi:MAG TPA: STAS domain-containing protein [Leptospiraceae bacterium]|nr:STAS domain-containing protein [Leptospiraceae bacterium]HMY69010.1 STAS domain-containing protein [Leptospiraceae bacterium]HNF12685.1 STAS domain-containing protein [Leptospiraceae bacterium]HNF23226.1 STAS domain-containing protein [Leptospiraceae bacterium]HNI24775.1 STAS domain-containing protein [Leptospiraceae bacterium]
MVEEFKIFVDYEKDPSVPVIHISGEITSEADEEITGSYSSIPNEKRSRVLIDFSKTAYINSAGIATLISLITKASENKGKIEFSGLNAHFRKVMDIVGLTDFVMIHESIEQALK